jgi:nitrogen-specific signal transduction histidine kinase
MTEKEESPKASCGHETNREIVAVVSTLFERIATIVERMTDDNVEPPDIFSAASLHGVVNQINSAAIIGDESTAERIVEATAGFVEVVTKIVNP